MQETAVHVLEELLRDEDAGVRLAAAESLGRLRAAGEREAVPALEQLSAAAIPPLPSEAAPRPAIDEVLICSAQGEVLYEWQCRNPDSWIRFFEFVSQKAQRLAQGLVLGEFNRLVIQNPDSRAVVLISADRGVLVHTRTAPPQNPASPAPAQKHDAAGRSP